jgi:hypothetical protein
MWKDTMSDITPLQFGGLRFGLATLVALSLVAGTASAQRVVPGSGIRVSGAGDDFEDADWKFIHNFPKSSRNIDKRVREPYGMSKNQRWFESPKRGQPDVLLRVTPPAGGIEGSTGALLMRSLHTGLPGVVTRTSQQDDLLFDVGTAVGGTIPVSKSPSVVVRVFLPEFDKWEDQTATSFGMRVAIMSTAIQQKKGVFGVRRVKKREIYFPGIFIQFNSKTDRNVEKDSAVFIIRGNDYGKDYIAAEIKQTGWWTLGMSFTPDGRTHYYVSPGVDDLTEKDRIASHFPQSVHCERFHTYFFNVCNSHDGVKWSTDWIIDDPALYVLRR